LVKYVILTPNKFDPTHILSNTVNIITNQSEMKLRWRYAMSKVISSQFEIPKVNETHFSLGKEMIEVLKLFFYIAVPIFLLALTWTHVR